MDLLIIVIASVFGACIASFLNVVAIRWHEDASLGGRSKCVSCGITLRPQHLIPILSWFWLGGRCENCRKPIHPQYVLVELLGAVIGGFSAWHTLIGSSPDIWRFVVEAGFGWSLLVPMVMDLRWKELPVEWMVGMGSVGAVLNVLGWGFLSDGTSWMRLGSICMGLFVALAFFGLQYRWSHGRWLGEGDVWMASALGAVFGWPGIVLVVYAAYLFGGLVAVIGLATGSLRAGQRFPFGPFLALGSLVALWWGDRLLAYFFV